MSQFDVTTNVLIVTVNELETRAVLDGFERHTGITAKTIQLGDRYYRDLGSLNQTRVFHALSEMGSSGVGGAQQTVEKAIRALTPEAILAIGIAFGIDAEKQTLGDILLSKQLCLYELQRKGNGIILRGDRPHASGWLINYFVGIAQTSWNGAIVRPGVILTGEKLIDDLDYRDELLNLEVEAIGGEMEGAGVYVSSHDHKVDWIVIKAICDWADGKKNEDKQNRQQVAANNAVEFLIHSLNEAPLIRGSNSNQIPSIHGGGNSTTVVSNVTSGGTLNLSPGDPDSKLLVQTILEQQQQILDYLNNAGDIPDPQIDEHLLWRLVDDIKKMRKKQELQKSLQFTVELKQKYEVNGSSWSQTLKTEVLLLLAEAERTKYLQSTSRGEPCDLSQLHEYLKELMNVSA